MTNSFDDVKCQLEILETKDTGNFTISGMSKDGDNC